MDIFVLFHAIIIRVGKSIGSGVAIDLVSATGIKTIPPRRTLPPAPELVKGSRVHLRIALGFQATLGVD